jgi:hypothetical protein
MNKDSKYTSDGFYPDGYTVKTQHIEVHNPVIELKNKFLQSGPVTDIWWPHGNRR